MFFIIIVCRTVYFFRFLSGNRIFIVGIILDNIVHEIESLFTVAVTVAGQGIPVYFGAGFVSDEIIHVIIPHVGVLAVGFCQSHGVEHVPRSGIVCCQGKFDAVQGIEIVFGKHFFEVFQVISPDMDIILRLYIILESELERGFRHDLH